MAFPAGTRFGVYEITGLIGVGGMGEVPDTPRPSQQIDVVVNWFAELNARVPTF